MAKFKVGDRVKVINGTGSLVAGSEWEVLGVETHGGDEFLRLKDCVECEKTNSAEWLSSRFELVEEKQPYKHTIRVTTDNFEYIGLKKGSEHEATVDEYGVAYFDCNGKCWQLNEFSYDSVFPEEVKEDVVNSPKPIKSDGGSSSYYDIDVDPWLYNRLVERQKEGNCYVKTEELIDIIFDNDFDSANAFKSLVRAWGSFNGGGKEGNDVAYEVNKIKYSADKLKQRFERKGE